MPMPSALSTLDKPAEALHHRGGWSHRRTRCRFAVEDAGELLIRQSRPVVADGDARELAKPRPGSRRDRRRGTRSCGCRRSTCRRCPSPPGRRTDEVEHGGRDRSPFGAARPQFGEQREPAANLAAHPLADTPFEGREHIVEIDQRRQGRQREAGAAGGAEGRSAVTIGAADGSVSSLGPTGGRGRRSREPDPRHSWQQFFGPATSAWRGSIATSRIRIGGDKGPPGWAVTSRMAGRGLNSPDRPSGSARPRRSSSPRFASNDRHPNSRAEFQDIAPSVAPHPLDSD